VPARPLFRRHLGAKLAREGVERSVDQKALERGTVVEFRRTDIGRSTQLQTERYALAMNRRTPCQVPGPCRQVE
jgi:hypothetical protein